ncbi:MAG: hypothetical protein O3A25_20540 [Acidobacteria bacterium]|nr:hypothetical protein [Acidobacteriota bacterium]
MRRNWQTPFLAAMKNSGNVRASCDAAGITRSVAYKSRNRHPAFAAQWDEALQDAIDTLEAVAWQRARTGLSDQVLLMLLRAHRPDLYSERLRIQVTREQDIEALMRVNGISHEEAESAITEAERILAAP